MTTAFERCTLAALLMLCACVPATVQTDSEPERDEAGIAEANRLGQMLYAYDQAAWHGTDAVMPLMRAEGSGMDNG